METDPNTYRDLGFTRARRFVDRTPPKSVDLNLLRAYHSGQLPEDEAEDVDFLIALFREWHEASGVVLNEVSELLASASIEIDTLPTSAAHSMDTRTQEQRRSFRAPIVMALGHSGESTNTITVAPEQCEWQPSRPQVLADKEGRITLQVTESGLLTVLIGGFLFDSDEYLLEVVWYAADTTEVARSSPPDPCDPVIRLAPQPNRVPTCGDELKIIAQYTPDEGEGWTVVVRVRLPDPD